MYFTLTSTIQLATYAFYAASLAYFNNYMFPHLTSVLQENEAFFNFNQLFLMTQHTYFIIMVTSFTMCILIPATFEQTGDYGLVKRRYNNAAKIVYFLTWLANFFYFLQLIYIALNGAFTLVVIPSVIVFIALCFQCAFSLIILFNKQHHMD